MGDSVDKYKMRDLLETFKTAILWFWYLFGIIAGAALWFFPLPSTRIQVFAWAGAFVLLSAISVMIAKVDSLKTELK